MDKDAAGPLQGGERLAWEVIETLGQGVAILGVDGRFQYVNGAGAQLMGRAPQELLGRTLSDIAHPDEHETLREARRQHEAGRRTVDDIRLLTPDGGEVYVQVTGAPHVQDGQVTGVYVVIADLREHRRATDGHVQQMTGAATDMADRTQAEQALRESRAQLAGVFASAMDAIISVDEKQRIVLFNAAAEQMFACRADAAIGQPLERFLPERFRAAHSRHIQQFARTGHTSRRMGNLGTLHALRADGREFPVEASISQAKMGENTLYTVILRDITDRLRTEEKLRLFMEQAPVALAMFDRDMRYMAHSRRWLDDYNLGDQVIVGRSHYDLFPEIPARWRAVHTRGLAGETVQAEEDLFLRLNGAQQWLRWQVQPWYAGDGAVGGIVIFSEDITARKQAERRLVEIQDILAQAESVANMGSWKWDLDTQLVTWSDGMFRLFGVEREGFDGDLAEVINTRIHPDDVEAVNRANIAVLEKHDPKPLEYRIVLPNGAVRTVWAEGRLARDAEGNPRALVGYVQDITRRKKAQNALRESQTQLQHVIDTVPEGVLLLSAEGLVRLANPVAEQHLALLAPAYTHGDLLTRLGGRSLQEFFTSPPAGLWHEIALENHTFEALAKPVEVHEVNAGWVLVLRDVTQERDIRRRVQRQERLAAVGQIAAGIAHDFNNTLAVITLYAQIIAREHGLPPAVYERLSTIEQQSQQATDLTQQILDFSRQSVMERQPLDLLSFMKEIVKLLGRTLPEHIQVALAYDEHAYTVRADPSRLQQVMMNMAFNARDAMPDGGRLQISLAHVSTQGKNPPLPGMPAGAWAQIRVTDSGSGIPRDSLPQIFEPFFTTKEVGKGTGLGLAQVYGIVQQHDGYIDVTSRVGSGTTFSLYLPALDRDEPATVAPDTAATVQGQGRLVLLVEDDAVTRQALADALTFMNFEVLEAENGGQALAILHTRSDDIALVVSDVVMPEMGGLALLHAMRRRGLKLPVVFLTGHPLGSELEEAQKFGLAGWLPKPANLNGLSRLLDKALNTAS